MQVFECAVFVVKSGIPGASSANQPSTSEPLKETGIKFKIAAVSLSSTVYTLIHLDGILEDS